MNAASPRRPASTLHFALCTFQFALCLLLCSSPAPAGELAVTLHNGADVTLVGAFLRWDDDGNHRKPVDPKAQIDAPQVDATAVKRGDQWVFANLPAGKYDLVILGKDLLRIEGWHYPPVLEFDPAFPPTAACDDEVRNFIVDDIRKSEHYENKVAPLYMGGDKKNVRVLVELIRDKATSYTKGFGTMRIEVWQYDWNYGGWQKNKRTKVLHRIGMQVDELRKWTWVWEPKLGGIDVKDDRVDLEYALPDRPDPQQLKGLYPY